MENPILAQYQKLVAFLAETLGPAYEIALYDLTKKDAPIIAIRNNQVSGRELGAPLSGMPLQLVQDESNQEQDCKLHYRELSARGKTLRSNTMFIRQDGELIGLLCISFDDSRYQAICGALMRLCHPTSFAEPMMVPVIDPEEKAAARSENETTVSCTTGDYISRELTRLGATAERLSPEERLNVIASLETNGVFKLKGAVEDVAHALQCSRATIYRYLSQLKREE